MDGRIIIIDGISNSGKTTFCEYLKKQGYFVIDEAPLFMQNHKELGTLPNTVPISLEQEKNNQVILYNVELERLKLAREKAIKGENVVMDRSFLSTVAVAFALENDLPFKGAYKYANELAILYFNELFNINNYAEINFVFFDVNQSVVFARNKNRDNILDSNWVNENFLMKQRQYFLECFKLLNATIIDTSNLSLDEVINIVFGNNKKI